jgi:hypothetical protein
LWKVAAAYNTEMTNLIDGTYTIYVRQYDSANVASVGTRSINVTKDTTAAPVSVELTSDVGNGQGGSTTDRRTSNGALTVGQPEQGGIIQYSTDNINWSTSYAPPTTAAQDGDKTVYVRQLDKAGNASSTTTFNYVFDKTAPDASAIVAALQAGNLGDTGTDAGDNRTNLVRPAYSGTAEGNARVDVTFTGSTGAPVTVTTTASPLGSWPIWQAPSRPASPLPTAQAMPPPKPVPALSSTPQPPRWC